MTEACVLKLEEHWSTKDQLGPAADPCDTYMLGSCWNPLDSGDFQGSIAVTHHYPGYELSTECSGLSSEEDACLACEEELLTERHTPHQQSALTKPGADLASIQLVSSSSVAQEVRETIRNEMIREAETQPGPYFHRLGLSKELRLMAVSWAVQVLDQFRAEQETLFLAVSYLDRFLSTTQDVVHTDGLQLATLACLCLASKQTEVAQPTIAEWTWLVQGNAWGTKEQLARMEWIVMDNLDWRGCTPTAWWFLHLFCYGLGTCPAQSICMAAYLLELGLFEDSCLELSYSSLAAAALLLGHTSVEQQVRQMGASVQPLTVDALVALAPELDLQQVHDACKLLARLHHAACQQPQPAEGEALQGLQLARVKYCGDTWHNVGSWPVPVDAAVVLAGL